MSWRTTLTLILLGVAIASGIAILRQRDRLRPTGQAEAKPDYVLHDFEIVTLDKEGHESVTLRAPASLTRRAASSICGSVAK